MGLRRYTTMEKMQIINMYCAGRREEILHRTGWTYETMQNRMCIWRKELNYTRKIDYKKKEGYVWDREKVRRLFKAKASGVTHEDLAERFGLTKGSMQVTYLRLRYKHPDLAEELLW